MRASLLRSHRFLAQHTFYPLALISAFACVLLAGRVYWSDSYTYVFMVWNLFLAWVPYVCSLFVAGLVATRRKHTWLVALAAGFWLLFFPNAPYIITDLLHLRRIDNFVQWYDVGMLASFGFAGLFLAVASLQTMQNLVRAALGTWVSWLFVLGIAGLSGLGVYMGRFLRWNSWDLFFAPRTVLRETAMMLVNPLDRLQIIGVTGMFAALLLVCYLMFVATRSSAYAAQRPDGR